MLESKSWNANELHHINHVGDNDNTLNANYWIFGIKTNKKNSLNFNFEANLLNLNRTKLK